MNKQVKILLMLLLLVLSCAFVAAAETKVHRKSEPVVAELFVTSW